MFDKVFLDHDDIHKASLGVARQLLNVRPKYANRVIYGVPRGGVPAAYAIARAFDSSYHKIEGPINVTSTPEHADVIVDDLIDSGKTETEWISRTQKPFMALFDKRTMPQKPWLVFPWEHTEEKSIEDAFVRLLQYIGEDPERGGLRETPGRMARAWSHWTSGYGRDVSAVMKSFEDGGELYDEMIHVANIPFYSHCEHHLAPFFGSVKFAYIPGKESKRIVGLSKMSRLVDIFSRRLQVQERLTTQIVDAFCNELNPQGAACVLKARHMCMESRGICQSGIETTTSALRGCIKDQPSARAEFFAL